MRGLSGLVPLLLITSCVVSTGSYFRSLNPTEYGKSVDEAPDKTRRMLRDWLDTATIEQGSFVVRRRPASITVQDYSDGSIHLRVTQGTGPALMELVAKVKPVEDRTRIDIHVDGARLANAMDDLGASRFHRELRDELATAMDAIDDHRVMPQGLLLSRVVRLAWDG